MNQEQINFHVTRDFSETFNISVKFLRQNFKLFIQSLLFIAGPFVLISSIAGAFYQANSINAISLIRSGNLLGQFGFYYFLFIFAAIISNIVIVGTVFAFMLEYMQKGYGNFSVNDVAKRLRQNIGNILAVFFSLTFFIVIFVCAMVGIFITIGNSSTALTILLALCLIIGMLILFPTLMWQLSVVYLVKMITNDSVLDSLGRTRSVMKNNFWWTWVLVVCALLAVGIISFVFSMPQFIYQMILMFSKMKGASSETPVAFLIIASICTFCTTLLYSILYVINAFHYFSLDEQKEGKGLLERINEIGKSPVSNVDQQY